MANESNPLTRFKPDVQATTAIESFVDHVELLTVIGADCVRVGECLEYRPNGKPVDDYPTVVVGRRAAIGGRAQGRAVIASAFNVVWELCVGPVPEGLVLDHLCERKSCVDINHLEPVSLGENSSRGKDFSRLRALELHAVRTGRISLIHVPRIAEYVAKRDARDAMYRRAFEARNDGLRIEIERLKSFDRPRTGLSFEELLAERRALLQQIHKLSHGGDADNYL